MSILSISIAGTTITGTTTYIREGTFELDDQIDQRTTCKFTVFDATGTQHYTKGQPVVVSDSVLGVLFTGFVNGSAETNLYPNPGIESQIDCIDNHSLADKR